MFGRRYAMDYLLKGLSFVLTVLAIGILFAIIAQVFLYGLPSLTPYFIFTPESETPGLGQGIANAIVGSVFLATLATILAIPLAITTAIYMQKYAPDNRITATLRFFIEVLSGTPSIVIGAFGLLVLVTYLKPFTGGFSLIAGSIALAILTIPVIERTIEDSIATCPADLEEGSYALGANKWQTIWNIVLPYAMSGIFTGIVLGFGRAAEESAVVILTAGYSQFLPEFTIRHNEKLFMATKIYPIQDLIGSLPYAVYHGYENANVIPISNAFACAFILICIVLTINLSAKILFSKTFSGRSRSNRLGVLLADNIDRFIPYFRKKPTQSSENHAGQQEFNNSIEDQDRTPTRPCVGSIQYDKFRITKNGWILAAMKKYLERLAFYKKRGVPPSISQNESAGVKRDSTRNFHTFLRTLIPFIIPAAILHLIAFLSGIPPLHYALGPASPSLAGIFGTGLVLIIVIAGLIFGLLLAKKNGVFREKTRRTGYAGVAIGICILCIAGIVCAGAAPGLFSTDSTGSSAASGSPADRKAQLDALISQMEAEEGGGSSVLVQGETPPAAVQQSLPIRAVVTGSGGTLIPVKDALTIGESYRYGDSTRICDATVYDYKVLPFYFWWFIDYNRFVQQVPPEGYSYLVVFIRMENIGTKSAIVPSAERVRVTNNGITYKNLPYFDESVLSSYQSDYYESHYDDLPYQWIRELGQDKRDYAFLTGYNIFGNWEWTNVTATTTTVTVTPTTTDAESDTETSSNNQTSTNGQGFFIKPGPGNAVDGYLIYEVPDYVVKEGLDGTYVEVTFNANSGTRWKLKSDNT